MTSSRKNEGGIQNKSSVRNEIENIMSSFDLHDVWRIKNPTAKRHTWRQKKPLVQCRLDFWLISDELYDYLKKYLIFCAPNTDHSAITLSLEIIENEHRGKGYWNFNSSLVNHEEYANCTENNYKLWRNEYANEVLDKRVLRDLIKHRIRFFTMSYCKTKA